MTRRYADGGPIYEIPLGDCQATLEAIVRIARERERAYLEPPPEDRLTGARMYIYGIAAGHKELADLIENVLKKMRQVK